MLKLTEVDPVPRNHTLPNTDPQFVTLKVVLRPQEAKQLAEIADILSRGCGIEIINHEGFRVDHPAAYTVRRFF